MTTHPELRNGDVLPSEGVLILEIEQKNATRVKLSPSVFKHLYE